MNFKLYTMHLRQALLCARAGAPLTAGRELERAVREREAMDVTQEALQRALTLEAAVDNACVELYLLRLSPR